MGTKYASVSVSGYNATPPADDGTVSEANKVKWSTIKTKLPDPLKTAIESIDTALVTAFDRGPTALTSNTTLGASHYEKFIQVSGSSVTLTLSDAASLGAGWNCWIVNTDSSNSVTIGRATGADTFNGSAANYTLKPTDRVHVFVNAAASGFLTAEPAIGGTRNVSGVTNMSAAINFAEGSDVASAGTTDIWSTTGNTVHVTGTTTITSLGTAPQVGATRWVIFDGALTLTHGANLRLPGAANITTAADDTMLVYADTTTQLDVISYVRAAVPPIAGGPATQAEQEAASSLTAYVTPGRQIYHPGSAKAWLKADAAGTINASYGTTSITDTGTGQLTWTLSTAFSSGGYPVIATALDSSGNLRNIEVVTQSATVVTFKSNDQTNAAADPGNWYTVAFGDQ